MKSMISKTTYREIKNSLGRYFAILAIVALGVGFFSGLKITKPAMIETANKYIEEHNLFDYRIISSLGFDSIDVSKVKNLKGISTAKGEISADFLCIRNKNIVEVIRAHSITPGINDLKLEYGSMPKSSNECVADSKMFSKSDIGQTIILSSDNTKNTLKMFKYTEYTIVGIVDSPYYLNFERGSTTLGNGTVTSFLYMDKSAFACNYYTEIYIKLNKTAGIYTNQYNNTVTYMKDSITNICNTRANIRYAKIVDKSTDELNNGISKYNANYSKYLSEKNKAEKEFQNNYGKILSAEKVLASKTIYLSTQKSSLIDSRSKIYVSASELSLNRKNVEANKPYMTAEDIQKTELELDTAEKVLDSSLSKINSGLLEIKSSENILLQAKITLANNKSDYYAAKSLTDKKFNSAKVKLDNAKNNIRIAKKNISEIAKPKCYILNRDSNIGYVSFENDSNIVNGIATVFPIFFFLIAALVCMTTMTRMVDEQRTQIGVLKALGYSKKTIMGKYLFYSGSAALIGCISGFIFGCYLFPKVIWHAYGMMYNFSNNIDYILNLNLALISILVALVCSIGATWLSCYEELKHAPAELIRPKSPKMGKRILLEKIPFIWNKVKFLYKVSIRNIFRYKKRFFMMVLGISGCTALLLTGFGINDSIKNIVSYQYDEILTYQYSINFENNQSISQQEKFKKDAASYVDELMFVHEGSADLVIGNKTKSLKLIVADDKKFSDFINLHTKTSSISYPKNGEAVICKKIADTYNLNVGDNITLRDSNMKTMNVVISGICENYFYNYIYISKSSCQNQWGYIPDFKTAYAKISNNAKYDAYASSSKILNLDGVDGVSVNNDLRVRVANMMKSLNAVIVLVILSAGALAFIVLYNLTNINITERIREIATIKVLGFYPMETSAYVFRENFALTGISSIVGLFLGKLLHGFVMSQIKVDIMYFDVRISVISYFLAVLLTFAFAIIVNLVMYYKLKNISMTESLKSVE